MFKKLFAKAAKPKNPLGLNKDFVAKLTAHLGRLGEVDPELAGRTLRFVIDDEDEDVVLTLGGLPQTGAALCVQTAASTQNWKLIQKVTEERAAVFRAGKGAPSAV